ncbi:hypothetical protein E2L08_10825 [Palleronia sediminis]|uniref:Type II secretory pathway, component PulF n=1 Tax=Palleronia sediminis TaxID=2547833 RepID=A0A4R6A6C0_9RHOB|nr:hypothetical protein [Palleronia sediminis]TDL78425.1 hypothetical protein E2L08_10825 [Palleronia sediminis]
MDKSPDKKRQQVFTLAVEVGRAPGDDLPEGSTGAMLLCYASGIDEAEAVRETVAVLKQAGLNPIEVEGHGTRAEREADGDEIDEDEGALMDRALEQNAVIVALMTPTHDED